VIGEREVSGGGRSVEEGLRMGGVNFLELLALHLP